MKEVLTGKKALITGAGIGIGEGIALEFARQGAEVVLHYAFDDERAPETAAAINSSGGRAWAVKGDFRDSAECKRVAESASDLLGGLDILVNSAGITHKVSFLDVTPELFEEAFAVNIGAYFFCAQPAVRSMIARGGGSIINITSIHAFAGLPDHSVYAATKGAIVTFTRQLAVELMPQQIRVNAVAPGHIEVERHRDDPTYSREDAERRIPWGRVGEPADIGRAAAFLASDSADYITGQVLYVDGGITSKMSLPPRKTT